MPIISIFSGSFCRGDSVADGVASQMGYKRIDERVLEYASQKSGIPRKKLLRTMAGPPPFFNRLTFEREKTLAYIRLALAEMIKSDNVVHHGLAGHFLPQNITHALRVCLIARLSFRVAEAAREAKLSAKQAKQVIREGDSERSRWTHSLHDMDPYVQELYDVVLPLHSMTVEEAVDKICHYAQQPAVQFTSESRQGVEDFLLASEVGVKMAEDGHDVEVTGSAGELLITLNRYVTRLDHYEKKLETLAMTVPGVKSVRTVPGTRFVPPPLVWAGDMDLPSKVLLVDDERDFVHTLSERLQARNLDSAIVYNGEEALSFIDSDEPEVMVLDLKMPGIDGIEVLRRVKRDHPGIEVIILTGHGSEKEKKRAEKLGAFAYLQKPIDVDVLAQVMRDAYQRIGRKRAEMAKSSGDGRSGRMED